MKHVLQIERTKYVLQIPDQKATARKVFTPSDNWMDVMKKCTPEFCLKTKVDEILSKYAKAAKARRKPVTGGVKRVFPRFYNDLSTHAYVTEYYRLNEEICRSDRAADIKEFYQPLTKHISIVSGEDTEELL